MTDDLAAFVADDLWLLVAIVTFALAGLAGVAGLGGLAGAITIVGWFLLTPVFLFWGEELAAIAFESDEPARGGDERARQRAHEPLETLKDRYARGEIDDAEFERRLDRLVETDEAIGRVDRSRSVDRHSSDRSNEFDAEPALEQE
ncbi:SHOCT domain-containing protein [Natronosalvus caseinilyticus]|uniref:SHOCT domain-containing protein n=1 Tax=Natronosalvus caseinilyticus TaxID=2953747 RepID=UPI0028AC511B|nr:SHOCT domain-containing protein [Natronosalvus caseinilyticus]